MRLTSSEYTWAQTTLAELLGLTGAMNRPVPLLATGYLLLRRLENRLGGNRNLHFVF